MRSLRHTIELKKGVRVDLLFTPHLYSFKGTQGVTFEADRTNELEMYELYADVLFCSALNAWVLDGHGNEDTFPHTRGDFHAWMIADPRAYGKALRHALEALTDKPIGALAQNASTGAESGKENEEAEDGSKKKRLSQPIGKILRRFW